jgi:hypothetical protein
MNKSWKKTKIKDSQLGNKKRLRSVTKIGKRNQSRLGTKKLRLTQSGAAVSVRRPRRRRTAPAPAPASARRAPAPVRRAAEAAQVEVAKKENAAAKVANRAETRAHAAALRSEAKPRIVRFKGLEGTEMGTSTNAEGLPRQAAARAVEAREKANIAARAAAAKAAAIAAEAKAMVKGEHEQKILNIMDYQSLYNKAKKAKNAKSKNILIKELLNNSNLQPIIGNIMNGKLIKSKEYNINNAAIHTLTELLKTKEAKAEVARRRAAEAIKNKAEVKISELQNTIARAENYIQKLKNSNIEFNKILNTNVVGLIKEIKNNILKNNSNVRNPDIIEKLNEVVESAKADENKITKLLKNPKTDELRKLMENLDRKGLDPLYAGLEEAVNPGTGGVNKPMYHAAAKAAKNPYVRHSSTAAAAKSAAEAAQSARPAPGPPKPQSALGEALSKFNLLRSEIKNQKSNLPILIEEIRKIRAKKTNINRTPNEKKNLANMENEVREKYSEISDKERELKKLYESLGQGPEPAAQRRRASTARRAAAAVQKTKKNPFQKISSFLRGQAEKKTNKIANVAVKGFIQQAQNFKNSNQPYEFKIAKLKLLKSDYLTIYKPLKEPLFFKDINNILSELKATRALPKVPEARKAKAVAEGVRAQRREEAQKREEEALISNIMDYQSLYTKAKKAKNANSKNILIKELLNNRGLQPIIGNIMNGELKNSKEYKINNAAIRTLTELLNTKEAKAEVAIRKEISNIQTKAEAKAIEGAEARKQRAEAKVAEAEKKTKKAEAEEAEKGPVLIESIKRLKAAKNDLEVATKEAEAPGIYVVAGAKQAIEGAEARKQRAEAKVAAEQRVVEAEQRVVEAVRLEAAKNDLKLATAEAAAAEKAKATQAARAAAEAAAAEKAAAEEEVEVYEVPIFAKAEKAAQAAQAAPPRPSQPSKNQYLAMIEARQKKRAEVEEATAAEVEKILNARQVKLEENIKPTPEERKAASTVRAKVLEEKLSKLTNQDVESTFKRLLSEYSYNNISKLSYSQKQKHKAIIDKIEKKTKSFKREGINGVERIPLESLNFLKTTKLSEKAYETELKKMIKGRNILNQEQGSREIKTQKIIENGKKRARKEIDETKRESNQLRKKILLSLTNKQRKQYESQLQNNDFFDIFKQIYSANTNVEKFFTLAKNLEGENKAVIEEAKKKIAAQAATNKAAAEKAAAQTAAQTAAKKAAKKNSNIGKLKNATKRSE